jgi:uncharacterized protein YndB with AHSA1/START domain
MGERHITVQRRMAAPVDSVWAVLADFPNLADHWRGLKATRSIGEQARGLGARRLVRLKPMGSMEETVIKWEDGRTIATKNEPSASVPFSQAEATLHIEPDGDGTVARFEYRYLPRGGPLGRVTGPLIDRMLTVQFTSMLSAVEKAARSAGDRAAVE